MNAPARIKAGLPLASLIDVLKLLAESAASSWELFPDKLEIPELADILQDFAECTKLVDALGQDLIHAIIAEPFAQHRREVRP